ncbi:MAG: NAD-dependent epimerase/dehydratase family protein, partial [Saprospiraceae bacterium]|nr:NAD-dependent epimerase/dehydratase family protein [Saprospiraceae bacterium]
MQIALTGASGRIGNVVARRLLAAGHRLRVLQRRDKPSLAGLPLEIVSGHLLDRPSLEALAEGCEALIHLAGLISVHGDRGGEVVRINVEGTRQVLEASLARGLRRVIVFSSVQAFSPPPAGRALDESAPLALQSAMAYNRAKAESLLLAQRFAAEHPLEVLTLCPTGVLGPYDYEPSLSGRMLIDFHRGRIPLLTPGGADWVD